jgi:hypothetical protein
MECGPRKYYEDWRKELREEQTLTSEEKKQKRKEEEDQQAEKEERPESLWLVAKL